MYPAHLAEMEALQPKLEGSIIYPGKHCMLLFNNSFVICLKKPQYVDKTIYITMYNMVVCICNVQRQRVSLSHIPSHPGALQTCQHRVTHHSHPWEPALYSCPLAGHSFLDSTHEGPWLILLFMMSSRFTDTVENDRICLLFETRS